LSLGGSSTKKKNDLPTTFKNDASNGELDISNRSKIILRLIICYRFKWYAL